MSPETFIKNHFLPTSKLEMLIALKICKNFASKINNSCPLLNPGLFVIKLHAPKTFPHNLTLLSSYKPPQLVIFQGKVKS